MMKAMREGVGRLLATIFILLLASCGGDSSSDGGTESPEEIETKTPNRAISGSVSLPSSAPLAMDAVTAEVLGEVTQPDENGQLSLKVQEEDLTDVTIMLPQREDDSLPTVYLFTTVLPGESSFTLDVEETAVSLLMNGISTDYLIGAGTPSEVKDIIRDYGRTFIEAFTAMLEADPYTLRAENLDNVYDQTYIDAALACKEALRERTGEATPQGAVPLAGGAWMLAAPPGMLADNVAVDNGAFVVRPSPESYDFLIHEDTGQLDSINVGGAMTGKIQIENDSMLFAHYRASDMISGTVLQESPTGLFEPAFHPDLLGPQGGWSTGFWASTGLFDANFQSVTLEIYTPGTVEFDWQEYQSGPSLSLSLRTIYSGVLLPGLTQILPASDQGLQRVFRVLIENGVWEAGFDKFAASDWTGGAKAIIFKVAEKQVLQSVVEEALKGVVTDPKVIAKYLGKAMVKFAVGAKSFELAGIAVDLTKLATDINTTPMRIEFQVIFPVSIDELSPTVLTKVADEEDNPVYTLTGTGLAPYSFGGADYFPQLYVESKNYDGEPIDSPVDPDSIMVNAEGTELEFQLPFEWTQISSEVAKPIYVKLLHSFVDYNGFDEVVPVNLPALAARENFRIDVADMAIISLSEDNVSENDSLVLNGRGFAPFFLDNRVVFTDDEGTVIDAEIDGGDGSYLIVTVPEGLAPGPLTVYVELTDGTRSNLKKLGMQPHMVSAEPASGTDFADTLDITLFQDQGTTIYYRIDGADEKSIYDNQLTLDGTAHVYAFAQVIVDGTEYNSPISDLFYYQCAAGETLVDGQCTVDNTGGALLDWSTYPSPQWCPMTNPAPDVFPGWYHELDIGTHTVWCSYHENHSILEEAPYLGYVSDGSEDGYSKTYNYDGSLRIYELFDNGERKESIAVNTDTPLWEP